MGDLNLIIFISFAIPLLMALFVSRGKTRTLLIFFFIGTVVCLFCGELNAIIMKQLPFEYNYFTSNITPFVEEIFKGLPILVFVFIFNPKRRTLLECAIMVGVGFAMLENAFVIANSISTVTVGYALARGFGSGMMHGVCTLLVGYGMSYVHVRRKLFYPGTLALLAMAMIYHSVYNTLVQTEYRIVGFILPVFSFVPILIYMNYIDRKREKEMQEKTS